MSDPLAALVRVGQRPVPEIDAGFADRLEARLRHVHAMPGEDRRPPHRAAWAALAGAIAVALAFVVTIAAGPDDDALTLSAATAASVVLPDGSVVPAEAGLELPDGALVRTGPGGSATAGGVRVPALATAVVVDDRLVLVDDDRSDEPRTTTTTARPATTAPPPTTASPPPTAPPRPPATAAPTTPTTRADTTTTAAPAPRLDLRAVPVGDGSITLHWTRYEGAAFGRYVVYRVGPAGTVVVAEITNPATTAALDRPPERRVGYQVVVLDPAGNVVASSPLTNVR